MKKLLIYFIACSVLFVIAFKTEAQITSEKGEPFLPESGDIAIGIDARPFTKIFNDVSNVNYSFLNNNAIYGKYFLDDQLAIRANLRANYTQTENTELIIQDGQEIPDPNIQVEDVETDKTTNIVVGAGIEKRKGNTRVQGFFGGELQFMMTKNLTEYEYGNDFSLINQNPSTTNFGTNIPAAGQRFTEIEAGNTYGMGIRAFVGVEYFIAPKLSVGGEFGWGFAYNFAGDGKNTLKYWENEGVKTVKIENAGGKAYDLDTDNFNGAVYFMFHF